MAYAEISSNLALDEYGRHPLLNHYLHTGVQRATPTTHFKLFKEYEEYEAAGRSHEMAEYFKPLKLHGHQIQAMHSILRQFFSKAKDPSNPLGVLVADCPGLGKSLEAKATITFLISIGMRQEAKASLPPLIGAIYSLRLPSAATDGTSSDTHPFLGALDKIPDLPTLIIAPGTLSDQWLNEGHAFVKPGHIHFFRYPNAKPARRKFFGPGGEFSKSSANPRNKIIIAPHSVRSFALKCIPETD